MVNALGQKSVNYGPQAKHGPPFVFVNKVLLEYSYAHLSGESNGNPLQYSFLENSIDTFPTCAQTATTLTMYKKAPGTRAMLNSLFNVCGWTL